VNTASIKTATQLLSKHGLAPLKKYGQNFLIDPNITEKIADSLHLTKDDCVFEVGPGLGALTLALARRAKKVVCVEIDKGLVSVLRDILSGHKNVTVIEGDILKTDIKKIAEEHFNGSFSACGNLPYYITAPILVKLVESGARDVTVMVQKEVATRLSASPGGKDYGVLTASIGYYAQPKTLFSVSRGSFYPAPDVDSAIVRMGLSSPPLPVPREWYVKTVRAAFAARRKTVYNNLAAVFGKKTGRRDPAGEALAACDIDPRRRAETLSPREFLMLARFFFSKNE
jgi:16S rRNA (adenine1518-N6/adenine1519-N6)-dimethyltransferase